MTRGASRWLLAGAALLVLALALLALAPATGAASFLWVLVGLWAVATILWLAWRLWRWMTYRVGVRLFVSYLLIGLTPILSMLAFALVALYMLAGQYTSVRYGGVLAETLVRLQATCEEVATVTAAHGAEAGLDRLRELRERQPAPVVPTVAWSVHDGMVTYRTSDPAKAFTVPAWVEEAESAIVRHAGGFAAMTAHREGDAVVAVMIPLDQATAWAISEAHWFDVAFATGVGAAGSPDVSVTASAGREGIQLQVEADEEGNDQLWPEWTSPEGGLIDQPLVVWFRIARGVRDLDTGEHLDDGTVLFLLRTSVDRAWDDFVLSRYDLHTGFRAVLLGVGGLFVLLYAFALLAATAMIVSITRSTSRLSKGARAVAEGDLDHRIPVRRRDQLGELAERFNHMTVSVQGMLADVAEKERLSRELELAREIQESLLPARRTVHGAATVAAVFRPAAEVGGDYFDVFPLEDGRLVVCIGDVAGHGLSTGLLMASLKSAVAALVHEGYGGPDLARRLNRVLTGQRPERTLVTFGMLELDAAAGTARYTTSAHTPPYLVAAGGDVTEVAVGSLPLGSPLAEPRTVELVVAPGTRVVLYSDGLVEALDPDGEPVGYERFRAVLAAHAGLEADELPAAVLRAWEVLVGGRDPADDVTLLVVGVGPAGSSALPASASVPLSRW